MLRAEKARKALSLLHHPKFISAALRHGVAASTEHLEAIRFAKANTLIDVGANKGQFSVAFRACFPHARIVAFEPLPDASTTYGAIFGSDPHVELHRLAIADTEGTAAFHVADRQDSSSLLKPAEGQERAFGVRGERLIEVAVKPLDACIDIAGLDGPTMMKIDVQGAELAVLRGCNFLAEIDFIYVELSFVLLYEDQPLFNDVFEYLRARQFTLAGVFNQVSTSAFGPTQADFLFARADNRAAA